MYKIPGVLLLLFLYGLLSPAIMGYAWQWTSKGEELPFTIEVPSDWVTEYAARSNGVIAVFSQRYARIEVRSFTMSEIPALDQLINMKAARLSSIYPGIRQVYQKKSDLKPGLYLTAWELRRGGTDFYEETAFYLFDNGVITVSCLAPRKMFKNFRVIFDNAIFSLRPDASAPVAEEKPVAKEKVAKGLLSLFPFVLPNAEKQVVMKWKSAPAEKPVPKEPAKKEPEKKAEKTEKKPDEPLEDFFLPPVE